MPPETVKPRDVHEWAEDAIADAERRGLPELRPLLENLAQALAILRAADWNDPSRRDETEDSSSKGARPR